MVAAEQDGEFGIGQAVRLHQILDFGRDALGFVFVVFARPDPDARALAVLAPKLLQVRVRVVGDDGIGGAQDACAAAVVLFELDDFQCGIITAEFIQIFRLGATPGINTLVVVADAGEHAAAAGQRFDHAVLGAIGVLAFVDQQIADLGLPACAYLTIGFQHLQGQADQVVEINGIEGLQPRLIARVQFGNLAFAHGGCGFGGLLGRQRQILHFRNPVVCGVQRVLVGAGR